MNTETLQEKKGAAIQIPHEWWPYMQKSGYFTTYYGDVYFGFIAECHGYDDRFFIIQNDKLKTFRELKESEKTLEKFRSLGWEIKDPKIITNTHPADRNNRLGSYAEDIDHTRDGSRYKKMFVFGAGASAFCVFGNKKNAFRKFNLRPPLGTELFHEDYEQFFRYYPGVELTLPAYEAEGRDIEQLMEKEWQNIRKAYNPNLLKHHINIQYYLQTLLSKVSINVANQYHHTNLFSLLFNKLQQYYVDKPREKFSVISFNYDTIADHFLSNMFECTFTSIHDYFNYKNQFLFFKPHGSCNWGWRFDGEKTRELGNTHIADKLYRNNITLDKIYYDYLGGYKENLAENSWGHELSLHQHNLGRFTLNKNRIEVILEGAEYYPALLLPYRDKDEFVMHYDQQLAMTTAMGNAEELYLIGWKGNEDVFNRQLARHKGHLKKIVIADPNPEAVIENLSKHLDLDEIEVTTVKDFEDFVLNHLDNYLDN